MRRNKGGTPGGRPRAPPSRETAANILPFTTGRHPATGKFASLSSPVGPPLFRQLSSFSFSVPTSQSQIAACNTSLVPPSPRDFSHFSPDVAPSPTLSNGSDPSSCLPLDCFTCRDPTLSPSERRAFVAFRAACGLLSNPWNLSSLSSLLKLTLPDFVKGFDRFFVSAPSHLHELSLYVCAATQLSPRNLPPLSASSSHPSLSCSSSSAFWIRVSRDPQHRSIHEMVSTVPFELDTLALLHQVPLVGLLLITYPDQVLRALESKILPDIAAKLLPPLSLEPEHDHGETVEGQQLDAKWRLQHSDFTTTQGHSERQLLLKTAPPCKVRLTRFPLVRHIERDDFRKISTVDAGKVVSITGEVARTGDLLAVEEERLMVCRQCGHTFRVFASADLGFQLDIPLKCPSGSASPASQPGDEDQTSGKRRHGTRGRGGQANRKPYFFFWRNKPRPGFCESESFEPAGPVFFMDYQEIHMKFATRAPFDGGGPSRHASIPIVLLHDLTGAVHPGESVTVIGVVRRKWDRFLRDTRCEVDLFIEAINIFRVRQRPPSLPLQLFKKLLHQHPAKSPDRQDEEESLQQYTLRQIWEIQDDKGRKGRRADRPSLKGLFHAFWQTTGRGGGQALRSSRDENYSPHDADAVDTEMHGRDEDAWDEWAARGRLIDEACPLLYGLASAKLALLLTLISGCTAKTIPERGFGDVASMIAGTSSESDERVGSFWDKYNKVSRKTAVPFSATDWPSPAQVPCKAEEDPGANQLDNKAASPPQSHTPEKREVTSRTRLQCHLLLLGGTGTGKSTLLLSAKKLMPRVCTTTGAGSTAAGLTCAAVRDSSSRGWQLDPGVLVLADRGVCCLDDLNLMRKDAQAAVLEAMEQQSISVAKAGIVTRLNSRCSIVAAHSTEFGAVDPCGDGCLKKKNRGGGNESLFGCGNAYDDLHCINVNIAPPLLSRFDVVAVLGSAPTVIEPTVDFILDQAMSAPRYRYKGSTRRTERKSANPTYATKKQEDSQESTPSGLYRNPVYSSPWLPTPRQTASTTRASPSFQGAGRPSGCGSSASRQSAVSASVHAARRDGVSDQHLGRLIKWSPSLLRYYITFIQKTYFPGLTRQAGQVLKRYYDRLRSGNTTGLSRGDSEGMMNLRGEGGGGGGSGVTFRFLESLFRLAQAHSRLMSRHEATRQDAVAVIWMLETALCGNRVVPGTKEANGSEDGRHGLLLLSQSETAELVNKLCRLSTPYQTRSVSPTASTRCPSRSSVRPSSEVSYVPLEVTAGKALHADIRSIADYKAVEFLVLRKLGLRLPVTRERTQTGMSVSPYGSYDERRVRFTHAVADESLELVDATTGTYDV
ncbi:mcm2 3 5 family [Cystoisospora suis]|uniref:Mcm2 3 5 family n=1 Tax=Cystoisospora suis TaxID=483139 RepID=A0A2C6LD15_9APIC|nr:mcm2 3 5 family [Cystoisospora suis]